MCSPTLRICLILTCSLWLACISLTGQIRAADRQTLVPPATLSISGLPATAGTPVDASHAPSGDETRDRRDGPAGDPRRDPALRQGWPVNLHAPGAGFPYTPTLFDGDSDGADEIFLTGGETFGLRGDGTFLPGWPTTDHLYMGYGTNGNKPGPAGADLDHDGDGEILWTERDWWAGSSRMWCFNGKNFDGTNLPNFPQFAPDDYSNALDTPFVLGDTDGDGNLEAWGPHTLGNNFVHYRISAFDHLGTRLFTVDLDPSENIQSLYFGDIEGDLSLEMFAVAWRDPSYILHAFAPDGGELPGYPVVLCTLAGGVLSLAPPFPADLDGDRDYEFLIGHWDGSGSRAHCVHHDGSPYPGFPITIATSSQLFYLGLGDLTGDGVPELIASDNHLGGNYRMHALDIASGMPLPGWPYPLANWPKGFPTIVDVNNDGYQDVCCATDGGTLLAIARDGSLIDGYPKFMTSASISGVAAGDIDGDGLFELVAATWDGWVYAWDTTGETLPGRADWPLRGINPRYTGIFGESSYAAGISSASLAALPGLRIAPNPALRRVEFLVGTAPHPLTLEICDAAGRVLEGQLVSGPQRVSWELPRGASAGVYFARIGRGATAQSSRFVVVR